MRRKWRMYDMIIICFLLERYMAARKLADDVRQLKSAATTGNY